MQMGDYRFDQAVAMDIGEKLLWALLILIATWLLARAAKWAFAKLVDNVGFFRRATGSGASLGESLGRILSLLIWLFGLLAILQVFDLGGVMSPVQTLLNSVMAFVPKLIGAGLIFFIGPRRGRYDDRQRHDKHHYRHGYLRADRDLRVDLGARCAGPGKRFGAGERDAAADLRCDPADNRSRDPARHRLSDRALRRSTAA
jgi:hypothetical protein